MTLANLKLPKDPKALKARRDRYAARVAIKRASDRLRVVADQATPAEITEGLAWYTRAERLAKSLSASYGLTTVQAAGILAVMSPAVSWAEQEAKTSEWIFRERLEDPMPFSGYPANIAKARAILEGAEASTVVKGPKVTMFWRAICGDTSAVCIDRHALRAALGTYTPEGDLRNAMTAGERRTVEAAYRQCAEQCDLNPREFQAIVWVVQRRLTLEDPKATGGTQ